MSRFEQPRRGSKRPSELPSMPVQVQHIQPPSQPQPPGSQEGSMLQSLTSGNMPYITLGAVGISIAMCIFLYRELRKMKSEIIDIAKTVHDNEQLETNTKSIENINEQLTQIKNMLQQMTRGPPTQPSPNQAQAMAMAQAAAQARAAQAAQAAQALPTLSEDESPEPESESESESEDECEDGVCEIPETKKEKKVLQI